MGPGRKARHSQELARRTRRRGSSSSATAPTSGGWSPGCSTECSDAGNELEGSRPQPVLASRRTRRMAAVPVRSAGGLRHCPGPDGGWIAGTVGTKEGGRRAGGRTWVGIGRPGSARPAAVGPAGSDRGRAGRPPGPINRPAFMVLVVPRTDPTGPAARARAPLADRSNYLGRSGPASRRARGSASAGFRKRTRSFRNVNEEKRGPPSGGRKTGLGKPSSMHLRFFRPHNPHGVGT
jgi:hypothetical protein